MEKNVVVKKALWAIGLLLMLGVSVGAYGFSQTGERTNCPGKVVCPLTGEEVCKDRCPLVDADRADCPGKVDCPLSGEQVCRDKCPLTGEAKLSTAEQDVPACCRKK